MHEMLYLGSQVENIKFFEESPEKMPENEEEEINKIKTSFQKLKENMARKSLENVSNDQSNALMIANNSSEQQNSTSYVTVSNSFQVHVKDSNQNTEAAQKNIRLSISNDLITDDEKENNLSY